MVLAKQLAFCLALALLACAQETASAQEQPNILFILTDDVGWGDMKPYNPDSQVSLPTIEELATEGMLFTDAHTSAAKCAPSRYSAITGNYQWRGKRGWGQWNYKGGSQILADQLTLGNVMQQAGYNAAFIGKHHLGADFFLKNSNNFASGSAPDSDVDFSRQFQDGLLENGFDYSFVAMRGIQDSPYAFFEDDLLFGNSNNLINWAVGNYGDTVIVKEGIGLPDWNTREVGPDLLEKAVDFIDSHHSANVASGTSQPFFVYYNTQGVHGPFRPAITIRGTPILGTTGVSSRTDLIREIDEVLNVLQTELASRGLLDNTLVIFTSDNGALRLNNELKLGHDSVGGLRGAKGMIFEGGHRVPLIVKWGDGTAGGSTIQPGTVTDDLIGVQDFYATLAALVGATGLAEQGRDSFNMLPVLLGQSGSLIRDHMIHEADNDEDSNKVARHLAFREGDWKLILDGNTQPDELYDLANDQQETTNLVNDPSQSARINQMLTRLTDLRNADRTAPELDDSLVQVPSVLGLTQIDAENAIGSAGLGVGTVSSAPSDTVPEGNTISQSPSASTWVSTGATVDLVVSSGPPVADVNEQPLFDSVAIIDAIQDAPYTYVVSASDPDAGQTALLSITATTVPAWLSLSSNGGGAETLSGTPTNADVGDHPISLLVTDPDGLTSSQDFTVTVANVNDQPSITSSPPAAGATQDIAYTYNITATDPDPGETAQLSFAATTLPAWLTLTDNNDGTATLSGTPGPMDVFLNNDVVIEVSDPGGSTVDQTFTITVANVNDAPVFTSIPITALTEASAYSYTITVVDPDLDGVAISATTLPVWLTFMDNGDGTATLSGSPTGAEVGDHAVDIQTQEVAPAPGLMASQQFIITVAAAADGPVVTLIGDANVTIDVNQAYSDEGATATDPQDGDLTAMIVVDNPVNTAIAATYTVTYSVNDTAGNMAQAQRTVTVRAATPPPPPPNSGGGGGGSAGLIDVLALLLLTLLVAGGRAAPGVIGGRRPRRR